MSLFSVLNGKNTQYSNRYISLVQLSYTYLKITILLFSDWVRFPLCNLTNIQTDKWHTAYYSCKLGTVRPVLDRRQPLTKGKTTNNPLNLYNNKFTL